MTWRRWILWGGLAVLVAAGLVYAFWPRPVLVDLAPVTRGALVVAIEEEGETRVRDVFTLSAPVTGRLRRVEVEVGDIVLAEATVVAELEPIDPELLDPRTLSEAEAAVSAAEAARDLTLAEQARARAELIFAESEVRRARGLRQGATISERQVDEAERAYRTARAALDRAGAELAMRESELRRARTRLISPLEARNAGAPCDCIPLRSPVSGRILEVHRESEGVVRAGDPIVEVGDPQDLEIVSDLLSSDAVKVEPGQRVEIEEWGGPVTLAGVVDRVEPFGFTKVSALGIEEQRVNVVIRLTDPLERWSRLGHGYRVEVRVVVWERPDALKVPLTALFREDGDWTVFADREGRARLTRVELGRTNGLEAEILKGLEEGDRVVLQPSHLITEGVRIAGRETRS